MMNPDEISFNTIKKEIVLPENLSDLLSLEYNTLEQNLKSIEEVTLDKLKHGLNKNQEYQESLNKILVKIESKLKQNKEKLEKIDRIISFKNKRNKIQLKKKQIEFYQYEESKSSPEVLRLLNTLRNSKRKKNYSSLYKNLYQGSSSEEEEEKSEDGDKSEDSDEEKMQREEKISKKLHLDAFLESYKGQDPRTINWIALAKKANTELAEERMRQNNMVITGIQLYRKFKEIDIQKKRTTWTTDDDEKLKSSVELHGLNNWKQVANHIDGKNTSLCFQRWAKFVNPLISKGRWNLEEDIKLVLAVEAYKVGNWISVASLFRNRTDVQCRERWCNILDPGLHGSNWSKEEDNQLMLFVQMYGKKWSKIAKELKTRTDNQCWRRYKLLLKPIRKKEALNFPAECLNVKINFKNPFIIIRKNDEVNDSNWTPVKSIKSDPESEKKQISEKKELSTEKKTRKKRKII